MPNHLGPGMLSGHAAVFPPRAQKRCAELSMAGGVGMWDTKTDRCALSLGIPLRDGSEGIGRRALGEGSNPEAARAATVMPGGR